MAKISQELAVHERSTQLTFDFVSTTVSSYPKPGKPTPATVPHSSNTLVREPLLLLEITKNFSLLERRLYILVLRELKNLQKIEREQIQPWTELRFQFHYSEIINGHTNASIKALVDKIRTRDISWTDHDNQSYKSIVIFPETEYQRNKGTIMLTMYHKVIPLFLDLSRGFSTYQLELALALTSDYAQVIYPYIARFRKTKVWRVAIDEFRRIVRAEDKYKNFAHLRQNVIDPALAQINAMTDYKVKVKTKLQGRAIIGLEFSINYTSTLTEPEEVVSKEDIAQQLEVILSMEPTAAADYVARELSYYSSLTQDQKNQILAGGEKLMSFLRANLYVQTGNINNPDAYMAEAVFHFKDKGRKSKELVYDAQPTGRVK